MTKPSVQTNHSAAWVFQTQVAFVVSFVALGTGIVYLPVGAWERAFLGLAALFAISSAIGLSKTLRDQHEARNVVARVDEVRLEKMLAEHDPFKAT